MIPRAGSLHQSFGMALEPLPFRGLSPPPGFAIFFTPTTLNAGRLPRWLCHSFELVSLQNLFIWKIQCFVLYSLHRPAFSVVGELSPFPFDAFTAFVASHFLFEPLSAWDFCSFCLLSLFEPLFKGRRKQGCKKTMARPEGAQALRAIQEALDEGRSLPVVNYILPI